ncbi:MAG: hypothetical protein KME26_25770 [Oscillatoria princeps RMCB-10]|nr:hypothetical protein [Oscillatoria princeps RMCB-10]
MASRSRKLCAATGPVPPEPVSLKSNPLCQCPEFLTLASAQNNLTFKPVSSGSRGTKAAAAQAL